MSHLPKGFTERIATFWSEDLAFLRSQEAKSFENLWSGGMDAYVQGEHAITLELFQKAVSVGFPPDRRVDGTDQYSIQWKNYQDGSSALRMAITAYLCRSDRFGEIASWAWERLSNTDRVLTGMHNSAGVVSLYRAYAAFVANRPNASIMDDLDRAARLIDEAPGHFHYALTSTLLILYRSRSGELPRSEAAGHLKTSLLDGCKGVQLVDGAFHALFLQDAHPDVFDPVLPRLYGG